MKFWQPLAITACLAAALPFRGDATLQSPPRTPSGAPPIVLWAWEEPEDLRALDPHRAGVAVLVERIFLGSSMQLLPRHQRISVPDGVWAEAVIRIETRSGFRDTEDLRAQTAYELLRAASLPRVSGLQVDFDATRSEHAFYSDVLRRVRDSLPPHTRLTMTALVSWCSTSNGWLSTLPVDAAVPMYFRLGQHAGSWTVREPLCSTTIGLSTDEPVTAPSDPSARRQVYLFSPRSWMSNQLSAVNRNQLPFDSKGKP